MNQPRLLLDFDETLFNHICMLEWIDEQWKHLYGIEPGMFSATINQHHTQIDELHRLYRHREHYELSGRPWEEVSATMARLAAEQGKDFCYPDVHPVLEKLVAAGQAMGILTFGDSEYQHYKINHCKVILGLGLPIYVVTEPKRVYLAREFANHPGILVDDKYPLGLPNHWQHVWINRQVPMRRPKKLTDSTTQIATLEQLPQLLRTNRDT